MKSSLDQARSFYKSSWPTLCKMMREIQLGGGSADSPPANGPSRVYAVKAGRALGLIEETDRKIRMTDFGRRMLRALDGPDDKDQVRMLRAALLALPQFESTLDLLRHILHGAQGTKFGPRHLGDAMRQAIAPINVDDGTMKVYALRFASWLKAARIITRNGGRNYSFVEGSDIPGKAKGLASSTAPSGANAGSEPDQVELVLLRLNEIVSDIRWAPEGVVDVSRVPEMLDQLGQVEAVGRTALAAFRRELEAAIKTRNQEIATLAWSTLADIRRLRSDLYLHDQPLSEESVQKSLTEIQE